MKKRGLIRVLVVALCALGLASGCAPRPMSRANPPQASAVHLVTLAGLSVAVEMTSDPAAAPRHAYPGSRIPPLLPGERFFVVLATARNSTDTTLSDITFLPPLHLTDSAGQVVPFLFEYGSIPSGSPKSVPHTVRFPTSSLVWVPPGLRPHGDMTITGVWRVPVGRQLKLTWSFGRRGAVSLDAR